MSDRYRNFAELNRHNRRELDFRITAVSRSTALAVIAPHGGGIEPGTSELARAIAGPDHSLYVFDGTRGSNAILHITSTHFDEPECLGLIGRCRSVLAIHGCAGREPVIQVGGLDLALRDRLADILNANGYSAVAGAGDLSGTSPDNICNRSTRNMGAQLEFSQGMRRRLFEDYQRRSSRGKPKDGFFDLVFLIRLAIIKYEQAGQANPA